MNHEVVVRVGMFSRRTTHRSVVVCVLLAAASAGCLLLALGLGSRPVPIPDIIGAFFPDAPERDNLVVVQWRWPRAVASLVLGASLGISGAIFQSLTRNPLGSPDIIGLNTGAYTGVVAAITLGATSFSSIVVGAMVGGIGTALVVYFLAFKGGVRGFRLIIIGIAVSAMLTAVNTWFTVKSDLSLALRVAVWGAGSLNGIRWPVVSTALIIAALLAATLPWASRRMRQLELGDDAAAMLGVRVEPSKAALVVVGVAFTAVVTAVAGPVSFVALAAPQIGRRLIGPGTSGGLTGGALVGAALLAAADLIAQHALPGAGLPVGAVTVCLGGGYLVWLLIRESRRS